MSTTVFLDFDGVIVTEDSRNFAYKVRKKFKDRDDSLQINQPNIDELIKFIAHIKDDVQIVISSDWRRFDSLETLRSWLQIRSIRTPIIAVTPQMTCRAEEIITWLQQNDPTSQPIIIDDFDEAFDPEWWDFVWTGKKPQFIKTDPEVGFFMRDVCLS